MQVDYICKLEISKTQFKKCMSIDIKIYTPVIKLSNQVFTASMV